MGTPAFLAISNWFQTQVVSIAASPEISPLSPGCRLLPPGTSFLSSHKPSIISSNFRSSSTYNVGTPAFLVIFKLYQTQVYSIVASPEISQLNPGCRRLPLGTSFHSSYEPSITSSNCRSTSTCKVGTHAFLAISSRFQTQVHSTMASPEISPLRPVCQRLPLVTSFHSSHKPSITSSICWSTSTCKVGTPPFWPFPVGSRHKSTL